MAALSGKEVNKQNKTTKENIKRSIQHQQVLNICIKMSFQIPHIYIYIERDFLNADTPLKKQTFFRHLINKIENHRNIVSNLASAVRVPSLLLSRFPQVKENLANDGDHAGVEHRRDGDVQQSAFVQHELHLVLLDFSHR